MPETRYEDDDSRLAPELHTAIGLTIRRLTVRTCDEQWKQVWRNVSRGKDGNVSSSFSAVVAVVQGRDVAAAAVVDFVVASLYYFVHREHSRTGTATTDAFNYASTGGSPF